MTDNQLNLSNNETAKPNLVLGNRVPRDFFVSKGSGESDITVHAGSYHLALRQAGIEMCNIIVYSSIMPGIACEVPRPAELTHGSVLETIMAVANGRKGERVTAGLIMGWLYDKATGTKHGGFVCEHNGSYSVSEIREKLESSLQELYQNGYADKYDLRDVRIETESFVCEKEYGTALISICFLNYIWPVTEV